MPAMRAVGSAIIVLLVATAAYGGERAWQAPAQSMRDSFTFWGWSADGHRFAYETYSFSGGEPNDCEEQAVLTVYDTTNDRPAPGGVLRVASGPRDAAGGCQVADVRAALAKQRGELLHRFAIVTRSPEPATFDEAARGDWTVALGGRMAAHARLDVDAAESRAGLAYRLTLRLDGGGERTIASRLAAGAERPTLADALAFTDRGRHAVVICVPVLYAVTHGSWSRWDCHATELVH
jgi:hypothetical protein